MPQNLEEYISEEVANKIIDTLRNAFKIMLYRVLGYYLVLHVCSTGVCRQEKY